MCARSVAHELHRSWSPKQLPSGAMAARAQSSIKMAVTTRAMTAQRYTNPSKPLHASNTIDKRRPQLALFHPRPASANRCLALSLLCCASCSMPSSCSLMCALISHSSSNIS